MRHRLGINVKQILIYILNTATHITAVAVTFSKNLKSLVLTSVNSFFFLSWNTAGIFAALHRQSADCASKQCFSNFRRGCCKRKAHLNVPCMIFGNVYIVCFLDLINVNWDVIHCTGMTFFLITVKIYCKVFTLILIWCNLCCTLTTLRSILRLRISLTVKHVFIYQ